MSQTTEVPEKLRPYEANGIDLNYGDGDDDATGDCPWCGGEGKFVVRVETGQWRCFVCNEGEENGKPIKGGNTHTFIKMLHKRSVEATKDDELQELAANRKVSVQALKAWGVCRSSINNDWLLPGYNPDGHLRTLYRYVRRETADSGRWFCLPTPTLGHQLFGMSQYSPKCETVYVCEGPWDGMALWELMGQVKVGDAGLTVTSNKAVSFLGTASVIAIASATAFNKNWCPMFRGKAVCLLCDSDHPKKSATTGAVDPPVGFSAMQRIAQALVRCDEQPKSVSFLNWGPDGYMPERPSGFDVRDQLNSNQALPVLEDD
jgi:ribosomal protein L37AE/L43A